MYGRTFAKRIADGMSGPNWLIIRIIKTLAVIQKSFNKGSHGVVIPLSGPLSLLYFQANFVAIRDVCRLLLQSVEQQQHAEIRGQGPQIGTCIAMAIPVSSPIYLQVDSEIQAHSINRLLGQKPVKRLLVSSDAAFIEEYPPLVQLDFAIRLNLHLLAGGSQESHLNQMPGLLLSL